MKKNFSLRVLSWILTLLMIVSMMPLSVFAETDSDANVVDSEESSVTNTDETSQESPEEVATVDNAASDMDFTDATADESGAGWTWTNSTKTLTLSGATIAVAVVLPDDAEIVVTEDTENSVKVTSGNAIYVDGDLAISGKGKLTVESGFQVADARAVRATGSVAVTDTQLIAKAECAIAAPSISITGSNVDIYGYYYGLHAKTTTGTADSVVTLTGVSGKIYGFGYGGINAHSETANVKVVLSECKDLEMYNEVTNDSTSVNFNFAGIRAYTRGGGMAATVKLDKCENVSITNSTMAILAANNANAANAAAAKVLVSITNSNEVKLTGYTSCYSAVFVNNYGIEEDDSSNLVITNSVATISAPNATALMTSTKSAPSEVDVSDSELTIEASLVGIRTIATSADYAETVISGTKIEFIAPTTSTPLVDESIGDNSVVDDSVYDEAAGNTVSVVRPAKTFEVATKAELEAAIADAQAGDTVLLTADIDYGTDHLTINKAITLDLGGKTLTTRARNYGLALYNGCTVKNGTLNHAGTVAAIKVWDAKEISDLDIDVTGTSSSGNAIGGVVIQANSVGVDVIKNVDIYSTAGQGVTNGIETYNCGNATEPVIGSMENVTIDAVGTGMLISAPCGTATNCTIKGGVSGIDMLLKGTYSVSLDLVNCTVEGGEQAVYAHDEQKGYTYVGSIKLAADENTEFVNANNVYLKEAIASTTDADIDDIRDYKVTFISNVAELLAFAAAVNAGNTFTGETVKLTADIDLAGVAWTPIGNTTNYFRGTFDGQTHTISNMTIEVNTPDTDQFLGLFGGVKNAVIKNLTMKDVSITAVGKKVRAAAVVGIADSEKSTPQVVALNFENITVDGCVITAEAKSGSALIGGVIGYSYPANMKNISVSDLTIDAKAEGNEVRAAAINGYVCGQNISNDGKTRMAFTVDTFNVQNVEITANAYTVFAGGYAPYTYYGYITLKNGTIDGLKITVDSHAAFVGGLVGYFWRSDSGHNVENVDITGIDFDVTTDYLGETRVGGMVGTSQSPNTKYTDCSVAGTIVERCSDSENPVNYHAKVGGFVARTYEYAMQTYTNCVADVDITASNVAGGFVGNHNSTVSYVNCEAKGDVTANIAGGFAGRLTEHGYTTDVTFDGCKASGSVTGTNVAGGFIGSTVNHEWAEWVAGEGTAYGKNVTLKDCVASNDVSGNGYVAAVVGELTLAADKDFAMTDVTYSSNLPAFLPENALGVAKVGDTYYATLAEAIAAANAVDGGATVTLLCDVTLGEKLIISGDVTISGAHTITWADDYNGTLFEIASGAKLTLNDVTIDGDNAWTFYDDTTTVENGQNWYTRFVNVGDEDKAINANVIVNAGTLTLNKVQIKNVTIASDSDNGKTSNTESGGYYLMYNDDLAIIKSDGGKVIMDQSSIVGNAGMILNAIGAETVISNTVIDGNFGCGNKGGIIIANGGTMELNDSSICGNKAMARSATILGVINGADVTMNGNTKIDNNKHIGVGSNTAGAIVVVEGVSQFVMNGGSISNNVGGRAGAIASRWADANSKIELKAGEIVGNTTTNDSWNGASVFLRCPATIGDGMEVEGTIVVNAAPAELEITGGAFNGSLIVTDGLVAEISGGTFNYDPSEWLVDGLGVVNNNGVYATTEDLYEVGGVAFKTLGEALAAAASGAEIKVLASHKISNTIVIDKNITLDLNGNTIAGVDDVYPVIRITNGANVTVKNGNITNGDYVFVLGASDGSSAGYLTIESGKFHGETTVASVTKGTLTINGGEFSVAPYEGSYEFTLNCVDANYRDGSAKIVVNGGKFYKFNPADNAADGAGTNYVSDAYAVSADGDYYTIITYVEWVKAELLAGNDVVLERDILITDYSLVNALKLPSNTNGMYNEAHGNGAIFHIIRPGVELDLNGHSIVWDAHDEYYCNKRQVSLFLVTGTGVAGETADFTVKDSVGGGKVDVHGMASGMYVLLTSAKATIEGGAWTNYPCKTCGASNIFLYPSHGGTLEITGGTFEQVGSDYLLGWAGASSATNGNSVGVDYDQTKVIISGGNFVDFNPSDVKFFDVSNSDQETINGCDEGFTPVDNGDGTFGVKTLKSIIEAAKDGDTVVIEGDTTISETLVINKNITLDLNGKTITMVTADNSVTSMIYNNGNLTIVDSKGDGKLSYHYTGTNAGDAYNTIESAPGSVLTIKGGTIENLSECMIAYAVDGLTNGSAGDVTINVEGGTLTSKKIAVRIFANSTTNTGTLNISGGEIFGRVIIHNANASANKAVLNITGGTFNTNGYKTDVLYVGGSNGEAGAITATVSGGMFKGEILSTINKGFIKGGTFSQQIAEELCVEGFTPVENEDGTYSVVVKTNVTIGSVEDLIAFSNAVTTNGKYQGVKVAANPDVVVTLTADLDLAGSGFAPIGNGAANAFSGTFDGQNHTISNMTLECNYYRGVGFFRSLGRGAVVKNLTFVNANVNNGAATSANHFYGVVAGFSNNLTLENVNVKDSFVTCKYAGAVMVGCLEGATNISNCEIDNVTLTTTNIRGAIYGILGNSASGHTATLTDNKVKDVVFIVNGEVKEISETLGYNSWNSGNEYAESTYVAQIGETKYSTLTAAIKAAVAGDVVTLIGDVKLAKSIEVKVDITLDLNGKTITGVDDVYPVIRITNDANVTVKNGNITNGDYVFVLGASDGSSAGYLTIESGKFHGETTVASVTKGTLTIKGGEFSVDPYEGSYAYLINCIDANYAAGDAKVVITGGTFHNWNPANNASEGAGTNFVPKGYASKENNGTYVVEFVPVAEVGGKQYASLAEAIEKATADDTITLLANVNEDVTINKNLTIDGASFEYTGTMTLNKVNVTIKNVDFVAGHIYKHKSTGVGGNYTISNCTFDGQRLEIYAINLGGTSSIVIENCTATDYGYGFLQVPASNNSVSVKNVEVSGVNYAFKIDYSNVVTMENVIIENSYYGIMDSNHGAKTYTIRNCTFADEVVYPIYVWERAAAATDTFVFEGENSFGTTEFAISNYAELVLGGADAKLTACEGLNVKTNVEYREVEYKNGAYVIASGKVINETTGAHYSSLKDAIEQAADGDKLVINKDMTIDSNGAVDLDGYKTLFNISGKSITIDLNGHKLYCDATISEMLVGFFATENDGHLTLMDSSAEGTGTVEIKASNNYVYALIVCYTNDSSITIEGGNYILDKAIDSLIYADGNEIITVNGGNFYLGNVGTGSNGKPWIFNAKGQNEAHVNVNGGTFNADIVHQYYPFEVLVAKEKALKNNGNGTWTIVDAVAYVNEQHFSGAWYTNEVGYATVEEALNAALNGNKGELDALTVTLLTDASATYVTVAPGVILDLNGKELTVSFLASFGDIVDGTAGGNGLIKVDAGQIILQKANSFLPIYDTESGGYRFFKAEFKILGTKETNNAAGALSAVKYGFAIIFENAEAYKLIAESEAHGLHMTIKVMLSDGREVDFQCPDSSLRNFANKKYEDSQNGESLNRAISFSVTGIDGLPEGVTITTEVQLIAVGTAYVFE